MSYLSGVICMVLNKTLCFVWFFCSAFFSFFVFFFFEMRSHYGYSGILRPLACLLVWNQALLCYTSWPLGSFSPLLRAAVTDVGNWVQRLLFVLFLDVQGTKPWYIHNSWATCPPDFTIVRLFVFVLLIMVRNIHSEVMVWFLVRAFVTLWSLGTLVINHLPYLTRIVLSSPN